MISHRRSKIGFLLSLLLTISNGSIAGPPTELQRCHNRLSSIVEKLDLMTQRERIYDSERPTCRDIYLEPVQRSYSKVTSVDECAEMIFTKRAEYRERRDALDGTRETYCEGSRKGCFVPFIPIPSSTPATLEICEDRMGSLSRYRTELAELAVAATSDYLAVQGEWGLACGISGYGGDGLGNLDVDYPCSSSSRSDALESCRTLLACERENVSRQRETLQNHYSDILDGLERICECR